MGFHLFGNHYLEFSSSFSGALCFYFFLLQFISSSNERINHGFRWFLSASFSILALFSQLLELFYFFILCLRALKIQIIPKFSFMYEFLYMTFYFFFFFFILRLFHKLSHIEPLHLQIFCSDRCLVPFSESFFSDHSLFLKSDIFLNFFKLAWPSLRINWQNLTLEILMIINLCFTILIFQSFYFPYHHLLWLNIFVFLSKVKNIFLSIYLPLQMIFACFSRSCTSLQLH